MKVGSLFTGIGGIDLAFQNAGFDIAWQVEIDDYCQKVLEKNFPDTVKFRDIYDLDKETVDNAVSLYYNSKNALQEDVMSRKRKDYSQAVKMYNDGLSIGEVATFYSITRQSMWKILQRRDVQFRDNKKYGQDNHFYRGGVTAHDRSQNILEQAMIKGIVERKLACESCDETSVFKDGRTGVQAHHSDYNKPLDVMWLCQTCHHEWHKNNTAIEYKGGEIGSQDNTVDVIVAGFP